jgi:hypothetical protein
MEGSARSQRAVHGILPGTLHPGKSALRGSFSEAFRKMRKAARWKRAPPIPQSQIT